ncbi:MAG: hypothetical protein OXH47_10190 [Paracoccaceae bacterium]|nr:hypothetical protein [Paracoccaceae bacterium]
MFVACNRPCPGVYVAGISKAVAQDSPKVMASDMANAGDLVAQLPKIMAEDYIQSYTPNPYPIPIPICPPGDPTCPWPSCPPGDPTCAQKKLLEEGIKVVVVKGGLEKYKSNDSDNKWGMLRFLQITGNAALQIMEQGNVVNFDSVSVTVIHELTVYKCNIGGMYLDNPKIPAAALSFKYVEPKCSPIVRPAKSE